jgi:methionyl-tRNA formyltransferase
VKVVRDVREQCGQIETQGANVCRSLGVTGNTFVKILILSPYPQEIERVIFKSADSVSSSNEPLGNCNADFLILYGYRHIIRKPLLEKFGNHIVNLHISLLPWNKGADPNFWSWFDGTPKGVSVHVVDEKIDTGPVLVSEPVRFRRDETLATSYVKLREAVVALFCREWSQIRNGKIDLHRQEGRGSYHRSRDKDRFWRRLPLGYDTPTSEVERLGASVALEEIEAGGI